MQGEEEEVDIIEHLLCSYSALSKRRLEFLGVTLTDHPARFDWKTNKSELENSLR